jgi:hypothetical protein
MDSTVIHNFGAALSISQSLNKVASKVTTMACSKTCLDWSDHIRLCNGSSAKTNQGYFLLLHEYQLILWFTFTDTVQYLLQQCLSLSDITVCIDHLICCHKACVMHSCKAKVGLKVFDEN